MRLFRRNVRPLPPAPALVVLVGIARVTAPDTLLESLPLDLCWAAAAGLVLWRFNSEERAVLTRQLRPGAAAVPDPT